MKKISILVLLGVFFGLFQLDGVRADAPAVPADSVVSSSPSTGQSTSSGVASAASQQQSGLGMFLPLILMFAVFYFLMIRPQQKKVKQHQEMLGQLKHGDEVVSASGILGKVTGMTDKVVTLEVADNVRLKMLKSQVSQVVKGQVKDLV